jgi:diguanylate cyclase (GGDEF)-like protein/PAS domain S-box-containing protein
MGRLTPLFRIASGLVALTCSLLIGLDMAGSRVQLCETLAAQATPAIQRNDVGAIRASLRAAVLRNEDVLSAGVRDGRGRLIVSTGDHRAAWNPEFKDRSTATHARVPLFKGGRRWGTIEVRFSQLHSGGFLGALWDRPLVRMLVLMALPGFVAYLFYLRRTLRHLDPSAVIPARVHTALNVMAEGVVLLDQDERIVLANSAFAEQVGRSSASLMGLKASKLEWKLKDSLEVPETFPWLEAIRNAETVMDFPLVLDTGSQEERRVFVVNGSPVLDGRGRAKGAIATFAEVTALERKSRELERCDPLTGLANRRAFLEVFENMFEVVKKRGGRLCCVMSDIDHFKRVNDDHGHAAGDEVLKRVAEALKDEVRVTDGACRYGGEEFLLMFPDAPIEGAVSVAERIRLRIRAPGFARVPITSSFGVSSITFGAATPADLINQADAALYASKEGGRDRITRWDELPKADD